MAEVASPSSSQRDNISQSTSAYDGSKQFDVCILTCDDSRCNWSSRTLLSSACERHRLKTSECELRFSDIDSPEEQLPSALVFALIVCNHNKKDFKQLWMRLKEHSAVVLGSMGRIEPPASARCCPIIEIEKNMNQFYREIESLVQENRVYDGCWVGNDYTQGIVDGRSPSEMQTKTTEIEDSASILYSEKHAPNFSADNSEDVKSPRFENMYDNESTALKSIGYESCGTTKEIFEDNEVYACLSDDGKDVFLETKTLQPSCSHTGSFVSQDYILPRENYDGIYPDYSCYLKYLKLVGGCKKEIFTFGKMILLEGCKILENSLQQTAV